MENQAPEVSLIHMPLEVTVYILPTHLKLDHQDWEESSVNNLKSYLKGKQLCPSLAISDMVGPVFMNL